MKRIALLASLIILSIFAVFFLLKKSVPFLSPNTSVPFNTSKKEVLLYKLGNFSLKISSDYIYPLGNESNQPVAVRVSQLLSTDQEEQCTKIGGISTIYLDRNVPQIERGAAGSLYIESWDQNDVTYTDKKITNINLQDAVKDPINRLDVLTKTDEAIFQDIIAISKKNKNTPVVMSYGVSDLNSCAGGRKDIPLAARKITSGKFDQLYFLEMTSLDGMYPPEISKQLIGQKNGSWLIITEDPILVLQSTRKNPCSQIENFPDELTCVREEWVKNYRNETTNQQWIDSILNMIEYNETTVSPTNPNLKTYISPQLGISFNYLAKEGTQNFYVTEQGNQICISSQKDDMKCSSGQYVEVFNKNPNETLEATIKKMFFSDQDPARCLVTTYHGENDPKTWTRAEITYPQKENDGMQEMLENNSHCSAKYSRKNIISYFLEDQTHKDKLLFFKIGQDNFSAGEGKTWQDTVKFN